MKKILIYGIGSLQNRGCEALVNSTIYQIDKEVELTAATFDYDHDKNMYKDRIRKFVNHHKQKEEEFTEKEKQQYEKIQQLPFDYNNYELFFQRDVVKELKTADLAIHIGGDNYCYGVNEWMYSINTKAKSLGKKTVLWGASLFDEIKDLALIEDLKKYDLLMLREKISYNAIRKYIEEEKLMLIPDPAFSMEPKKVKLNDWYQGRKILGLNLSPLTVKTEENKQAIKDFVEDILKHTDYSIALLPHVSVEEVSDLKTLKQVKEQFSNKERVFLEEGTYDCQELKYIISQCKLLVAARTHASIAAYSTNVPTLVIGYSVKSRGIAEEIFGNYQNYVLSTEELKGEALIEKFHYIEKNKEDIKKQLDQKMKVMKIEAQNIYQKMSERLDYLDKKQVCPKEKCIGCTACLNSCPVGAIHFVKNREGFYYPEIDLEKCIHCNLCRKRCCIRNKIEQKQDKKLLTCYAAKAKEDAIRKVSSSGGIFHYLAEYVLSKQGVVYGATMEAFQVKHLRVTNIEDLIKIRGSKYSQSTLNTIFKQVKEDLENKKTVLFSGTPCQILGLKKYLDKDYKKLYTVSVICHGVMNDELLNKRIKEFENQYETKMNQVIYKSKINGWDKSSIEYQSSRIHKSYAFMEDSLMNLYINNLILRDSCYECPAKGLDNNVADIVLGDYWGIYHVHKELFDNLGVSAIMVKTEKGRILFDKIEKNLIRTETKYSQIAEYNPAFYQSMKKPLYHHKIFCDLKNNDLEIVTEFAKSQIKLDRTEKEYTKNSELIRQELQVAQQELKASQQEMNQVYSSKRFKLANKIGSIISKIKK